MGRALTAQELRTLQAAAAPHHPAWQRCLARVRDLHARNVAILVGVNMREPVHAMVCWTKGGRVDGGTGMVIRLARHYRIPILNLAGMDVREVMDRLDRVAQARDRRDAEQEAAISGGSADASPSVTPARHSATSGMRTGGRRRVSRSRGPMEDWLTGNLQRRA